jgi:hypothetical protein
MTHYLLLQPGARETTYLLRAASYSGHWWTQYCGQRSFGLSGTFCDCRRKCCLAVWPFLQPFRTCR